MNQNDQVFTRYLRDMEEAVFVVEHDGGRITFTNAKFREMFHVAQAPAGETAISFAEFMKDNDDPRNDVFHQVILDAIYDRQNTHRKEVPFYQGNVKWVLNVTTSFLYSEDGEKPIGVVVVANDVTEEARLRQAKKNANVSFALFTGFLSLAVFAVALIQQLKLPLTQPQITIVLEIIAVVFMGVLLKITHPTLKDMGLVLTNPKKTLTEAGIVTAVVLVLLVAVKLVIMQVKPDYFPAGTPFLDFSRPNLNPLTYIVTAFLQEFVARGVAQSNLNQVFDGKHGKVIALIISALLFGATHIHYGFNFMLMAALLVGILGIMYNRQQNVWGVYIVHYFAGIAAISLTLI